MSEEGNPETIPMADLDQFVQTLTAWHLAKCAVVKHLLTIPEGTELTVGNDGEAQTLITLTGDALSAFKLGIEMALSELGTLPFVAEMGDEAELEHAP